MAKGKNQKAKKKATKDTQATRDARNLKRKEARAVKAAAKKSAAMMLPPPEAQSPPEVTSVKVVDAEYDVKAPGGIMINGRRFGPGLCMIPGPYVRQVMILDEPFQEEN